MYAENRVNVERTLRSLNYLVSRIDAAEWSEVPFISRTNGFDRYRHAMYTRLLFFSRILVRRADLIQTTIIIFLARWKTWANWLLN